MKALFYGQGANPALFPCMSIDSCAGHFSDAILYRALSPEEWRGYVHTQKERAVHALETASELKLLRCPFCSYAEFEDNS